MFVGINVLVFGFNRYVLMPYLAAGSSAGGPITMLNGIIMAIINGQLGGQIYGSAYGVGYHRKDRADIWLFYVNFFITLCNTMFNLALTIYAVQATDPEVAQAGVSAFLSTLSSVSVGLESEIGYKLYLMLIPGQFFVSPLMGYLTGCIVQYVQVTLVAKIIYVWKCLPDLLLKLLKLLLPWAPDNLKEYDRRSAEMGFRAGQIGLPWDYSNLILNPLLVFFTFFFVSMNSWTESAGLVAWAVFFFGYSRFMHLRVQSVGFYSTHKLDWNVWIVWGAALSTVATCAVAWEFRSGAVLKGAPLWQKWAILFATYAAGCLLWVGCLVILHPGSMEKGPDARDGDFLNCKKDWIFSWFNCNPVFTVKCLHYLPKLLQDSEVAQDASAILDKASCWGHPIACGDDPNEVRYYSPGKEYLHFGPEKQKKIQELDLHDWLEFESYLEALAHVADLCRRNRGHIKPEELYQQMDLLKIDFNAVKICMEDHAGVKYLLRGMTRPVAAAPLGPGHPRPKLPATPMSADFPLHEKVSELPAAQFRELRSYLELEFAKQHDLLNVLLHRGSLPVQLASEETISLLTAPEEVEEPAAELAENGERVSVGSLAQLKLDATPSRARKETIFWKTSENKMAQAQQQASQLTRARRAHSSETAGARSCLERIVSSDRFNNLIMFLIMANVILMGIEVDVSSTLGQGDIPRWFNTVNLIMVSGFVVETILKHLAFGCSGFWCGAESGWNIFDFAVVVVSVVECALDLWAQSLDANSGQVRILRTVRLIRALRGMRLVRLFRYVVALRTLLLSIIATTGSLFWTLLLLITLCYSFGMAIAQFVMDHCRFEAIDRTHDPNAIPDCPANLRKFWSSVPDSMLTLFLAISGGISWDEAFRPLREFSPLGTALLLLYIVIAVFAILNVVTGVFCNTAIESASADKELATVKYERKKKSQVETLRKIFEELDSSSADNISIKDVETAMSRGRLSNFLESMGISTEDVWTFFMLIDANENGLLDLDEFVSGCMQLNGPARSIQLAKMSYENKVTRREIRNIMEELKQVSEQVSGVGVSPQVMEGRRKRAMLSEAF
ncbi:SCN10A [Symbiodinium sp. KB8]|nr:SCN10A [Symbiodinium sp. KB8]